MDDFDKATLAEVMRTTAKTQELVTASLGLQAVIIQGLISAKVVDADRLMTFLDLGFQDLIPEEKEGAFGYCYSTLLAVLNLSSPTEGGKPH